MKKKLFLTNFQAPGDVLMMTCAVRDLMNAHADKFEVNVKTTAMEIWENNPHLNRSITESTADTIIQCGYPLIHKSNTHPFHFCMGFVQDLANKLGVDIPQGEFKPDVHISDKEKSWISQVHEVTGKDLKFWIIVAGTKKDFTAKAWELTRFQKVVDHFKNRIVFVQCGERGHGHPGLKNVIDLRGKTDTRQLIRLVYNSCGVFCGVTFFMHLAAGIEPKQDRTWKNRPAVIIAGGREPTQWEAYPHHRYLSRCGMLECCDNGGCWKSRVTALKDNDKEKNESLCLHPIKTFSGQVIPKCLDMISAEDVIREIELYDEGYKYTGKPMKNKGFSLSEFLHKKPEFDAVKNDEKDKKINNCSWAKEIYPSIR